MRKITLPITLLICLGLSLPLQAADDKGSYAIWGVGNTTCHRYNKARENNAYQAYKDYTLGYLTAYNTLSEDTYRVTGKMHLDDVLDWLDTACHTTPVTSFELSLRNMITNLYAKRLHKAPKKKRGGW